MGSLKSNPILIRASEILEAGDWVRYQLYKNGARCALGAVMDAIVPGSSKRSTYNGRESYPSKAWRNKHPEFKTAEAQLMKHLGLKSHVWKWNDSHGRTKSEVVSALRDAATCNAAMED